MKLELNGMKLEGTPEELSEFMRNMQGVKADGAKINEEELFEGMLVTAVAGSRTENDRFNPHEEGVLKVTSFIARQQDPFSVRVQSDNGIRVRDWIRLEDLRKV